MPDPDYWETLFDVPAILDAFGFSSETGDVAELGCGYGTFTIPLAQRIRGIVHAIDLEPEMVSTTTRRAAAAKLSNVRTSVRDVLHGGFGVAPASCEACLLFNILHAEQPLELLKAAREVLGVGGLLAIIHWRSDLPTPRGPSLEIRPTPAQIGTWVATVDGLRVENQSMTLAPWHFGVSVRRTL